MRAQLKPAIIILALLTLITGVIYPLAVTVIAQVAFPAQANGSLIMRDGQPIGSRLIGQPFDDPKYFWGRFVGDAHVSRTTLTPRSLLPDRTTARLNPALIDDGAGAYQGVARRPIRGTARPIPVDLVTSSGSGLDPHISPAAAEYQVARVARVRGIGSKRSCGSSWRSTRRGAIWVCWASRA